MRWIRHPGRALDAYLDGELDTCHIDRVVTHLSQCPLCRQRVAITQRIGRSLQAMARNLST